MGGGLGLDISHDGGRATVRVAGELDMATAPDLADCLADLDGRDVVVDLTDVSYVGSSGLTVLVQARRHRLERGGRLTLTGLQDHVRRVFEVTGLLDQFA